MATKISYRITGLDCAEEVSLLKSTIGDLPGVKDLSFDILNAKMTVSFDENLVSSKSIEDKVAEAGMSAHEWKKRRPSSKAPRFGLKNSRSALTSLSGALTALAFLFHSYNDGFLAAIGDGHAVLPLAVKALYSVGAAAGIWLTLPKAWLSLKRRTPDMNLLMTLAVFGALAIGQWFEASTVAFLFAFSVSLEAWSVGRARNAVGALMALTPPLARVLHSSPLPEVPDHEHMMDVEKVPVGSRVLIKPGERFPLDGKIILGSTFVNQAPITGESQMIEKAPGSEVFAGTINGEGTVEFRTTKMSEDTTVAKIIRTVGEGQSRRSPSEQWVEQFARYYTPTVITLALLVMLAPPLMGHGTWAQRFYEGLVLLVIACPCALLISTPVSIVAAMASAAKNGVLVKGGLYMEMPSKIRALALDKTGTLTAGHPEVQGIIALSGHSERELIEIAAAIESQSEHPLAKAIVKHAQSLGIKPKNATDFKILAGKGATAILDGKKVWIGSHNFLEERGQESPEMHTKLESLTTEGYSIVIIGNEDHVCGFISLADKIRTNAKNFVTALEDAGIRPLVMLSGDNRGTALAVAKSLGITDVRSELLPEGKLKEIEALVRQHEFVAMIGDGVNDAPAMARSSLGIAMAVAGSDAAIETADIALMTDDLSKVPWLIAHSRRTVRIIRQNVGVSLIVKSVFMVLASVGHSSLWMAIAADMGVSLLVLFNAMRLLRV